MRAGVIDLGSNSISTGIYEIEKGKLLHLHSQQEYVGIIADIYNDNLSQEGIVRLGEVLERMLSLCTLLKCDHTLCLATASLRYLHNKEQVVQKMMDDFALPVHVLTGMEEARCAFEGMKYGQSLTTGLGCDLGGGSCQLFTFSKGAYAQAVSLPIGSLKMYHLYVQGILPSRTEMQHMIQLTQDLLSEYTFLQEQKSRTLCCMGGTARAVAELHMAVSGNRTKVQEYTMDRAGLDILMDTLRSKHLDGIGLMNRIVPQRLHTTVTGLLMLKTIADFCGSDSFVVSKYSIKEGYLLLHRDKLTAGL